MNVRLFAVAQQIAGCDNIDVDLDAPATVGEVRRKLGEMVPDLAPLLGQMMFAVDTDYASDDTPVHEKSDIACIPPVSGG